MKSPYMLIAGDREAADGTVALRHHEKGDLGTIGLEQFIENVKNEIKNKTK